MQLRDMLISQEPQELFDAAIRGMAAQGYRCNVYTKRMTRDHCAVGHCLTAEAQDYLLRRGKNRDTVKLLKDSSISTSLYELLCDLQASNDDSATRAQFHAHMGQVAQTHGLALMTYHALLNEEWLAQKAWQR